MESNTEQFKAIWSANDFPNMCWHDCPIYAMRFDNELLFDLDYILKWELNEQTKYYSFWIAPATLVFHNVKNLKIDIELNFINGLEMDEVINEKVNEKENKFSIETQEGSICFIATGFTQYLKCKPIYSNEQCIEEAVRKGYNFNLNTYI